MKELLKYFLGMGDTEEFCNFGFAHFAPILIMIGLILVMWKFQDQIRGFRHEKRLRYVLAFLLICSERSSASHRLCLIFAISGYSPVRFLR